MGASESLGAYVRLNVLWVDGYSAAKELRQWRRMHAEFGRTHKLRDMRASKVSPLFFLALLVNKKDRFWHSNQHVFMPAPKWVETQIALLDLLPHGEFVKELGLWRNGVDVPSRRYYINLHDPKQRYDLLGRFDTQNTAINYMNI